MKYIKKYNENIDTFDVDFAITKIKEQFPFEKVKEMLDKEILEWTNDTSSARSSYSDYSNGEAENAIIIYLIDWYLSKYWDEELFSSDDESDLSDSIKKEYNFLKY
jgi:hypothetical protein